MSILPQVPVPLLLLISIAIAAFLIYAPYIVVAYGRFKAGFDMAAPRAIFDKLPDYAKRATWAHQNSFESFMMYAAAALMAYVTQVNSPTAAIAAIAYLIARLLFSTCYIFNIPIGRSLMFGIGSASIFTLMILSIKQQMGR